MAFLRSFHAASDPFSISFQADAVEFSISVILSLTACLWSREPSFFYSSYLSHQQLIALLSFSDHPSEIHLGHLVLPLLNHFFLSLNRIFRGCADGFRCIAFTSPIVTGGIDFSARHGLLYFETAQHQGTANDAHKRKFSIHSFLSLFERS